MSLPSRFSGTGSLEFEFDRSDEMSINYQCIYVSGVEINLSEATQETNLIQLYYADEQGEDLLWDSNPSNKRHVSYTPNQHIPLPNGARLVLRYANPDEREVTARFLWRV